MKFSPIAQHGLLLALWTAIGLAFRTIDLTALPPWTDECATIAFSAGNGFLSVPTDSAISTSELTAPLWLTPENTARDVWSYLNLESTHPPLYFWLAHFWMRLWMPEGGFTWESRELLLWVARLLPAVLGAAGIPAMFGLARVAFGAGPAGLAIAHLSAALMAVSPFAVSLAREARHYTFVLLFVMASFACTIAIVRGLGLFERRSSQPANDRLWSIALGWGLVNAAGMATHYFFALTLAIEAAVVLGAIGVNGLRSGHWIGWRSWRLLMVAAVPTVLGAAIWIPAWQGLSNTSLTDWVQDGSPGLDAIFRLLSWLVAMLFALPTDDLRLPLGWLIAFGLALLLLFGLTGRWVAIGLQTWRRSPAIAPDALSPILGLAGCGIAATLAVTFLFQRDLTLAIRFSYPYFPAILLLVAAGLGGLWQRGNVRPIAIVLTASFLGAMFTAFDLTYLQHHRPDRMAEVIFERADRPVLLATLHKHHGQTGRAIGVAWELGRLAERAKAEGRETLNFDDPNSPDIRYLLARRSNLLAKRPEDAIESHARAGDTLRRLLLDRDPTTIPTGLEVWPMNFRDPIEWAGTGCTEDERERPDVREYHYRRFTCSPAPHPGS